MRLAATRDVDVDAVLGAVLACPAVVGLDGGMAGEVATYLPGRRVSGLRVRDDAVVVQVVMRRDSTATQAGRQVQQAVRPLVAPRRVDVVIGDLEPAPQAARPAAPLPPPPLSSQPPLLPR